MSIIATIVSLSMIVLTMMAAVKNNKKTAIFGVIIGAGGMTVTGIGIDAPVIRTILNLIIIGAGIWLWTRYFDSSNAS